MNRNKYVFWGLVITTLISALDANIMQTASPTIVRQLGGMELFAWVFSVYMLASTITVPLYGKLSDMYGRKRLLMISVGLFTIGSILCGMANSMVMLIVFRGVQGLGAGGMVPLSMIIVGDLFTIERRGKIQAVFSSIWAISSVVGPILVSFFGTSNFIPLYLQEGNHMSIYKSGLILLSIAVGWMFGSTPAGKWIIRFGYKPLFIIGSFITTISGLLLYLFVNDISYLVLFLIFTVEGVAFGFVCAC